MIYDGLIQLLLGVEPNYLLYSGVLTHWTPVHNGATTLNIFSPPRGGDENFYEPPLNGDSGAAPVKLKIDVKLPYKIL